MAAEAAAMSTVSAHECPPGSSEPNGSRAHITPAGSSTAQTAHHGFIRAVMPKLRISRRRTFTVYSQKSSHVSARLPR